MRRFMEILEGVAILALTAWIVANAFTVGP